MFFDISGFLHGINFLVLAIGVYGIGEMIWTIELDPRQDHHDEAEMSFAGVIRDAKEGMRARLEGHDDRLVPGLLRRHPAGRRAQRPAR